MTPEPVPPPLEEVASIVTTLGSTLVAIPVVCVTEDVSLTVTLAGPDAVVTVSGANNAAPA